MSGAAVFLRSRTQSPATKNLSASTNGGTTSPKLVNRRHSKSMSPEPRTFSPTTTDMNRVHEELEKLNIATDVINKLELQLDQARETFREIQTSWTQKLEQLSKKLGTCIEKSRPYYEARMRLLEAQQEAQRAALRFERASTLHAVAKQQVSLTQESLNGQKGARDVDPACLEVLNHHVQRVNEAERERLQSEDEHKYISCRVEEANRRVLGLEKELKRSIQKSKSYFEARVEFTKVLEDQKALIQRLEKEIKQKKQDYTTSLRNLERISEEIHERRQSLGRRDPGVGCETPDPPPPRKDSDVFGDNKISTTTVDQHKVYLRRKSKNSSSTARVDDIMEILGAKAMGNNLDGLKDEDRRRAESMPADIVNIGEKSNRLSSGVILLAQHLLSTSGNGKLNEEIQQIDRKTRAFSFPPEQLDLQYKTEPEGVKPFPTPPETPASPQIHLTTTTSNAIVRPGSDTNLLKKQASFASSSLADNGFNSETSSISSFAIDDDQVERIIMRSPYGLMKEMDKIYDRVQNSAEQSEEDSGCPSIRTTHLLTTDFLPERTSASGAEDSSA